MGFVFFRFVAMGFAAFGGCWRLQADESHHDGGHEGTMVERPPSKDELVTPGPRLPYMRENGENEGEGLSLEG